MNAKEKQNLFGESVRGGRTTLMDVRGGHGFPVCGELGLTFSGYYTCLSAMLFTFQNRKGQKCYLLFID